MYVLQNINRFLQWSESCTLAESHWTKGDTL